VNGALRQAETEVNTRWRAHLIEFEIAQPKAASDQQLKIHIENIEESQRSEQKTKIIYLRARCYKKELKCIS